MADDVGPTRWELPLSRQRRVFGEVVRRRTPDWVKRLLSVRAKATARAVLGIEPWPDLAVRHPLFRTPEYRAAREAARAFDVEKPNKPALERGHQTSFVLAQWFAAAGVERAFHVGYASGRHVFYLSATGIECGGTDLPEEDTAWVQIPEGTLDAATCRRLLRLDFFRLTPADLDALWVRSAPLSVLFSEATFETMLPWREGGASIPGYLALPPGELRALMHERFPSKLEELKASVRNMVFIEPEPGAGEAGAVFEACAKRLPEMSYAVWTFRAPFDRLFRLSPRYPTRQTVYTFTRDPRLLDELRVYADPL